MSKKETAVIADILDTNRSLSLFYISQLKAIDAEREIVLDGKKFNSLYWIIAHLIWAEDFLVVRSCGKPSVAHDWVNHYDFGSNGSLHENRIEMKELLDVMKDVHQKCLNHILELNEEDLDKDNVINISFGKNDHSIRMILKHAIRHEGTHIGHLSWLCKMNDISTF